MPQRAWLTPAREPRRAGGSNWKPPSLPSNLRVEKLAYIVVEERVDGVLGILVSPWPKATSDGHLSFPRTPAQTEVAADVDELQAFLDANRRTPTVRDRARGRTLRTRPVALGDVFAAEVDREALAEASETEAETQGLTPVSDWLGQPVYDVTSDAREAARTTFYDAVTPKLPPKVERQMVRKIRRQEKEGPPPA